MSSREDYLNEMFPKIGRRISPSADDEKWDEVHEKLKGLTRPQFVRLLQILNERGFLTDDDRDGYLRRLEDIPE